MERKLHEYFSAGATLVWVVDPETKSVKVHTAPDHFTLVDEHGTLDGGNVLPGFTLPVAEWFRRAGEQAEE